MFVVLKIVGAMLMPPVLIAMGMVICIALVMKRRMRGVAMLLVVTCSAYYLLAIEPTAAALAWTLERSYRQSIPVPVPSLDGATIVVLGNGAGKAEGYRSIAELSGTSWRRLWRGISTYRALGESIPLMYIGGSGNPFDPVSHEAELARSYAVMMGMPVEQFLIETHSRNTHENAIAVQRLRNERHLEGSVFLVTSARHLPRAAAVFARLGIAVIPIAADYYGGSFHVSPLSFVPSVDAFASSVTSMYEWVGMLGYRMLGRI
ncbi:MAG: YdcF family protein [bacterium]|nr:YdcF family protein [bacterium]